MNNPPADNVPVKFGHDGRIFSIPVSAWGLPESAALIAQIRNENSVIPPEKLYEIIKNGEFGTNTDVNILSVNHVKPNGTLRDLKSFVISIHQYVDANAETDVKDDHVIIQFEKGGLVSYVYLPMNEAGIAKFVKNTLY